ncbi:MAG: HAMP domain-containing histidine kinase [Actinobacteria bacterium]|nr:HAMP domain-containing histidine kinase [Actinomycetota bacterium]MCA1719866.1 HAMP domain-containing histidine kinase [Actinomycetota bacterium]
MTADAPSLDQLGIGRLFDLVPDPVVVGDTASGTIIAWNTAAVATFGYSREEALTLSLAALVPDRLRAAHRDGLAAYAAGGGGALVGAPGLVEVPGLRADGQEIWVELRLASLDAAIGGRRYVLAVLRDVTDRHRAQNETAAALEQVRQANGALHEFVQMLSHDLRSPLAGVQGSFDLLLRSIDRLTPEQRTGILDRGRRQSRVALELVDDLLDLTQIETGQLTASPEQCDLRALLHAAAETAAVPLDLSSVAAVQVWADPRHVHRVLVNLLTNAKKYGRPPIDVEVVPRPGSVDVAVVDSGDGVPDELVPRLFEKFSRAEGTGQSGTGLGLSIVAGLMRLGAGSAGYERGATGGSRFVVSWSSGPATSPDR